MAFKDKECRVRGRKVNCLQLKERISEKTREATSAKITKSPSGASLGVA